MSEPIVIPLGENCQLGAALELYGYQESSLLKWAHISSSHLLRACKEGINTMFAPSLSKTLFRLPNGKRGLIGTSTSIQLPNNGAWGTFEEYGSSLFRVGNGMTRAHSTLEV